MDNWCVHLCYQKSKYLFVVILNESDIQALKTRRLMGLHSRCFKAQVLIMSAEDIALYPDNLYRMYNICDEDITMRIHLNVPIDEDVMDWKFMTRDYLQVIIYLEY